MSVKYYWVGEAVVSRTFSWPRNAPCGKHK